MGTVLEEREDPEVPLSLRYGVEIRSESSIHQVLAANPMLPDVDTAREFWIPTEEEAAELATIAGAQPREV